MSKAPTAAGKSSYDLIDKDIFWVNLALKPDMTVLDLASGAGRYTLPLAERVGPGGKVIALDLWPEGIAQLTTAARQAGMTNIEGHVVDAGRALPIMADSVDLCLMATVLHDFVADGIDRDALQEVRRVLKPAGILAVVEFKKQEGPPGPPKAVRLTLEEVTKHLLPFGLIRFGAVTELGPHAYLAQFRSLAASRQAVQK
jgi:ubiquinone/menaquinone biosynthesis C-methylase UbiE